MKITLLKILCAIVVLVSPLSTLGLSVSSQTIMSSSYLSSIPMAPADSILGINEAFKACKNSNKVNICVGAYRDELGKPWVLPSVREAELCMLQDPTVNKEYASISGDATFVDLALKFAYGWDANLSTIAGVQSLSGTGACRIGGQFLSNFLPKGTKIYVPVPTW